MSMWFRGAARRRTVKMEDGNTASVQFSTPLRPLGSEVDLPSGVEMASVTVDHRDSPIGVKAIAWVLDNDGKAISLPEVDRALAGEPVQGALMIGDAQIIAETAVRKKTDKEGSDVEEHRFTLRVAFDDKAPFCTSSLGRILRDKRVVLTLTEAQVLLPAMPPKRKVGRPKKDEAQLELVEGDKPSAPVLHLVPPLVVGTADEAEQVQGEAPAPAVFDAAQDLLDVAEGNPLPPAILPEEAESMLDKASRAKRVKAEFAMLPENPEEENGLIAPRVERSIREGGFDRVRLGTLVKALKEMMPNSGWTLGTVAELVDSAPDLLGRNPNGTVFSKLAVDPSVA